MKDYRKSHDAPECPVDYESHYCSGRGYFYWNYFEKPYLENLFERLGREYQGRYLDFACGTGRILEIAASHFTESVGIDVSENMLAAAREKSSGSRLIRADVTVHPPEIGTFSVISLFRFLLNAENDARERVLSWLRNVIEPGGVLMVNNHLNKYSASGRIVQFRNFLNSHNRAPVLTDSEVETILNRSRFRIYDRYGFGLIPPWQKRRLFPSHLLLQLEQGMARIKALQNYTKDRIYLCHPV